MGLGTLRRHYPSGDGSAANGPARTREQVLEDQLLAERERSERLLAEVIALRSAAASAASAPAPADVPAPVETAEPVVDAAQAVAGPGPVKTEPSGRMSRRSR